MISGDNTFTTDEDYLSSKNILFSFGFRTYNLNGTVIERFYIIVYLLFEGTNRKVYGYKSALH